ncbi:MAG: ABC transporter permease [Thermoplasmatales archaeon]|nr:ABC transporter permease [Thermoplasmatales archaeon]
MGHVEGGPVTVNIIGDALRVAWADLRHLRRNILTVMLSLLVMPLLYLFTFTFGIGSVVGKIEGVTYAAFVIPGVVALSTVTSCFSNTASKILGQRLFHTSFDMISLCPISTPAIVLGKSTAGFVRGMLGAAVLLTLGWAIAPELRITPMLIASVAVSCLAFAFLGVTAGMLARAITDLSVFNSLVIMPMTFLCGTMFSVSAYPAVAQAAIQALPLTHSTACIRAAALGWAFPWASFLVTVVYALVFFAVAYYMIVRSWD